MCMCVYLCFDGKVVAFVKVPLSICKSLPPDRHFTHERSGVQVCHWVWIVIMSVTMHESVCL